MLSNFVHSLDVHNRRPAGLFPSVQLIVLIALICPWSEVKQCLVFDDRIPGISFVNQFIAVKYLCLQRISSAQESAYSSSLVKVLFSMTETHIFMRLVQ